jgi:arylsulfatase A-like enzyme
VTEVDDVLAADIPTLPEILGFYGYDTLAYAPVASRASFRSGEGLERGFQIFEEGHGPTTDMDLAASIAELPQPWFALMHFKDAHAPYGLGPQEPDADPRVLEWASRSRAGSGDADGWMRAQLAADAALGQHVKAMYDRAITRSDAAVGSILFQLAAQDMLEHTVVVVAGDHGETLGEHGEIGHQGILEPEVLHVPLLIVLPERLAAGVRVRDTVGLVDLPPTLLELAGAVPPAGIDGRSLAPFLRGESLPPRGVLAQGELRLNVPEAAPSGASGSGLLGGPAEVLVLGDEWLRYALATGMGQYRRWNGDTWVLQADEAPPQALLAERARLSRDAASKTTRVVTDAERDALRREGYW